MIDLKAARAEPDAYRSALARKGDEAARLFDELLAVDARWLEVLPQVDALRSKTKLKGKPSPEQLEELKQVKIDLKSLEDELTRVEGERRALLDRLPNPPDVSAPDGVAEEDAVEIRRVGEIPCLRLPRPGSRRPRASARLPIDLERGARTFGRAVRVPDGRRRPAGAHALPLRARPALPEGLRTGAAAGAGARGRDVRHQLLPHRRGEHLRRRARRAVPRRHVGCARGAAHGRDPRGPSTPLRRLLDLLPPRGRRRRQGRAGCFRVTSSTRSRCSSSRRQGHRATSTRPSWRSRRAWSRRLQIPYRVVNVAAGDLGASASKKYDIEAWFPGQERWREITSTSNTTDFQARRLEVRYRAESGPATVHTLNGTAVTARAMIALMESFQDEGGSISVPEPLWGFGAPGRLGRAPRAGGPASRATIRPGGVPERSNRTVLKTAGRASASWVRIPPPPLGSTGQASSPMDERGDRHGCEPAGGDEDPEALGDPR